MPDQQALAIREEAPLTEGGAFLAVIAAATRDDRVDVGKMQALLEMRRQIMKDEAEIAFNQAMCRLQPRLPRVDKRGKIIIAPKEGKAGQSTPFARYEDIDEAIRSLLAEEGFSVSYDSETTAQGVIWKCIILHSAGHHRISTMPPMPNDTSGSKNAVQAVGSTNQYAKRYSLCNALNIVTKGLDDDGHSADYLTDQQVSTITDMLNELALPPARVLKFLEVAGADSIEHIKQTAFGRVWQNLKTLLDKKREGRA